MHTRDGHPLVGSPKATFLTIVTIIRTSAKKQNTTPSMDENASGTVENAIMPSRAYKNSFQKDHFVSPFFLSIFSNSSHYVEKPTQPKNPFEKRLYSSMDKMASTNCLVISL